MVEGGENGRYWLKSVDKKARFDTQIGDVGDAKAGELVLAELTGNAHKKSARVTQVLGDPFAPKSFSLIAIHKYGIPFEMPEATEREAERVRELPVTNDHREDLRHLPIIAIDPRDARDFDDAIWLPNTSENNKMIAGLKWHHKVDSICKWAYKVSCGNEYLCEYARQFNANVVRLVIDLKRFEL